MADEIEASDGALFAEHKAWHGLGIVVEEAPSPREALRMAGLDWTVHKSRSISAEGLASDRYAAIIRDDTQTILGVVSRAYTPVQNSQLFELAYALGSEDLAKPIVANQATEAEPRNNHPATDAMAGWARRFDAVPCAFDSAASFGGTPRCWIQRLAGNRKV